jgi:hypothetical protein
MTVIFGKIFGTSANLLQYHFELSHLSKETPESWKIQLRLRAQNQV